MRTSLLCLVLGALVACTAPTEDLELERWVAQAQNVTIIRDDFGVPHVFGKTDADAVFGLMYAQAEDDFQRVERNYIWALGRLAEVEGKDSLYSDLRARLYMTKQQAIENYEKSPPWLKALCDAFADGLNYYLHTHPETVPALLTRFEPWMPMYFTEGSIGGDIERVPTANIQAFYEHDGSPRAIALNDTLASTVGLDQEPRGSNGFAIAPELTQSGNAMLLINPHTSFFFRGEVHVVSEQGLNAYGAVTWGQFFVYQGFNEYAGWMHTSTGVDIIDEFAETVEHNYDMDKLVYRYGEKWRPVQSSEITLAYRDGDDMGERSFTAYHTHHGPITGIMQDGRWMATSIMWDPVNALTQSYIRTKTTGLASFREMMDIRTNSSNNTVYADAQGNIGYWHGNFIPKRNVAFDYSQPVDGSNPATDWNGLHEQSDSIVIVNPENGWIQNANSTPFTAADEYSPQAQDYPFYMAPDEENFRGIQAVRLLRQARDLTLDKLISLAYDPYLTGFEILIPALVDAYDAASEPDAALTQPIDVLRAWDFNVNAQSIAMSLAHYFGTLYLDEGDSPAGLSVMEKVHYLATQSASDERIAIFKKSLAQLVEDFGSWQTPWGEINRYQRLDGRIQQRFDDSAPSVAIPMASSRWGALASFGARRYPDTKRIYGTSGNSFVAVVEFGDRVKAKSLLAGGQSGDPASPHFDDQVQRYVDGDFKDVAFYREDIEKRAERTYRPGQR